MDESKSADDAPFDLEAEEQARIAERRQRVGLDGAKQDETLVGLALSGGGVRSGAFCVGFLQSFCRLGLIRFVDYLSSVSGGSYASASHATYADAQQHVQPGDADQSSLYRPFGPIPVAPGVVVDPIQRMASRINYLARSWTFFNRQMIGAAYTLTMVISGLVAATSLMAFILRSLDYKSVRYALRPFGVHDDVRLALFPSVVIFGLWIVAWSISYFRNRSRATGNGARVFFVLWVTSLAMALCMLFGTGEISLLDKGYFLGANDGRVSNYRSPMGWAPVLAVLLGAILPYFSPFRLLRSGVSPQNVIDKTFYWLATRVVLFGIPLALLTYFAQEDISHFNSKRAGLILENPEFAGWEISSTSPLWLQVLDDGSGEEAPANDEVARRREIVDSIRSRINQVLATDSSGLTLSTAFDKLRLLQLRRDKALEKTDEGVAWLALASLIPGSAIEKEDTGKSRPAANQAESSNPVAEFYAVRWEIDELKQRLARSLNACVLDPGFYQTFQGKAPPAVCGRGDDAEIRAFCSLLDEAAALGAEVRRRYPNESALWQKGEGLSWNHVATCSLRVVEQTESGDPWRSLTLVNRELLEMAFPKTLYPASTVFSYVVLNRDQNRRLATATFSLILFLILSLATNLNNTSLHGFYARQLRRAWMSDAFDVGERVRLAEISTTSAGRPLPLIGAALNDVDVPVWRASGSAVNHRYFLFGPHACGASPRHCERTRRYMQGRITLEDAVAISGAALSGPHLRDSFAKLVLFLTNLRLGQWLRRPGMADNGEGWSKSGKLQRVSPARAFLSTFRPPEQRRICFVADGGFYDNTAVAELMRRRCKLIVAVDAGADADGEFADAARLMRLGRDLGVKITAPDGSPSFPLDELTMPPSKSNDFWNRRGDPGEKDGKAAPWAKRDFLVLKLHYAAASGPADRSISEGWLVLVKSSMTADAPQELVQRRKTFPKFPNDPTVDQFFDAIQFDSYRLLGEHIGERLSREILKNAPRGGAAGKSIDDHVFAAQMTYQELIAAIDELGKHELKTSRHG